MSKLEDQLSEYFTALHRGDDDGGVTMPSYPVGEPARPRRSRHRRTALVVAAIVVVAALATFGLVKSTEDSSTYVGTPGTDRPAPPPVPDGWKAVVFQTIQFAVPEDWPVYDDPRCWDPSSSAAYLGGPPASAKCSNPGALGVGAIPYANNWETHISQLEAAGGQQTQANGTVHSLRSLNGLRAVVITTKADDGAYWMYGIVLPDERVAMELTPVDPDDDDLAQRVIETIGAAPDSNPPPTPTIVEEPTTESIPAVPPSEPTPDPVEPSTESATGGDMNAFCARTEELRQSGQILSDGSYGPDTASYLQRMLDAAPTEFRPPLQTMLTWVEQGAPMPKPAEVSQAEGQSTRDWARSCSGSSAK